jgi:hypothetical protein
MRLDGRLNGIDKRFDGLARYMEDFRGEVVVRLGAIETQIGILAASQANFEARLPGTYVSVEPFHLFRYLDEQTFRYNNREEMNDYDRFRLALSQITGKRLTYDRLTGKDRESASEPEPTAI